MQAGGYGCCPILDAICCADNQHCCPADTVCQSPNLCEPRGGGPSFLAFLKLPTLPPASAGARAVGDEAAAITLPPRALPPKSVAATANIEGGGVTVTQQQCPDGTLCADSQTCCPYASGGYACCAGQDAVCCPDGLHCCPAGYTCDNGCVASAASLSDTAAATDVLAFISLMSRGRVVPQPRPGRPAVATAAGAEGPSRLLDARAAAANPLEGVATDDVIAAGGFVVPATNKKCDAVVSCDDSNTCCPTSFDGYACCPMERAVCCADKLHCCPEAHSCTSGSPPTPLLSFSSRCPRASPTPQHCGMKVGAHRRLYFFPPLSPVSLKSAVACDIAPCPAAARSIHPAAGHPRARTGTDDGYCMSSTGAVGPSSAFLPAAGSGPSKRPLLRGAAHSDSSIQGVSAI